MIVGFCRPCHEGLFRNHAGTCCGTGVGLHMVPTVADSLKATPLRNTLSELEVVPYARAIPTRHEATRPETCPNVSHSVGSTDWFDALLGSILPVFIEIRYAAGCFTALGGRSVS